jgi:hypothetical protein
MKINNIWLIAVLVLSLASACSSGKKSLNSGNYDEAVFQSVERLQSNGNHRKASTVLQASYPLAVKYHLDRITNLAATNSVNRFDQIVNEYESLNRLYDKVQLSPAALNLVAALRYTQQLTDAKNAAAKFHYNLGEQNINLASKQAAKQAYLEYELAATYAPNLYTDYQLKMDKAMSLAITRILVLPTEVHSNILKISNDYFKNKIIQYLYERPLSKFVLFYDQNDAKTSNVKIDEILDLSFDDFVVGQLTTNKLERKAINDSVKTKTTVKINGKDTVVVGYRKAEATLFVTRKTVESTGVLDVKIVNAYSKTIVQQEKIPGTFIWVNQFGTYQGEKVALTDADLKLVGNLDSPVPAPQQLFYEFTAPIFTKLMRRLEDRYRNY